MKKVFALVDCNNFYASCERLFRPELNGRPVVVLSNNDGCVIARSNEAKALGIGMGVPYFQNKTLLQQHNVHVFSSNYALYGDLSHRVMDLLQQMEPEVEIYSIDEAFIGLPVSQARPLTEYGHRLRKRIRQCVGIPVSIGIAPTKTLAKIANRIAKKNLSCDGVFDMTGHNDPDRLLASVAVEDVWGIGRQYAEKLNRRGIVNGLQLKNADPAWIRKHLTVTGLRTVMELQGVSCLPPCRCTGGPEIAGQLQVFWAAGNVAGRTAGGGGLLCVGRRGPAPCPGTGGRFPACFSCHQPFQRGSAPVFIYPDDWTGPTHRLHVHPDPFRLPGPGTALQAGLSVPEGRGDVDRADAPESMSAEPVSAAD